MDYKVQHIPLSKAQRGGRKTTMTTITIHSTGNARSTAQNERDNLARVGNDRVASFHIAVDDKMAIECIPLNEVAWHAGNSVGNNTSIGIEICESGNRNTTVRNTVELVAKMLHERNWDTTNLRRHFDWSGKNCPSIFSANNWKLWNDFKSDVQKELNKLTTPKKTNPIIQTNPDVWAKADWDWAKDKGYLDGTRPKDNLTRQEMAIIIRRIVNNVK